MRLPTSTMKQESVVRMRSVQRFISRVWMIERVKRVKEEPSPSLSPSLSPSPAQPSSARLGSHTHCHSHRHTQTSVHLLLVHQFGRIHEVLSVVQDDCSRDGAGRSPEHHVG